MDFENNIISVRRTSNYTAKKGVYTDTTKTRKSQRTLKFPQEIMDMLKEYKLEQDEQALKCGDKWVETDRLYTKWNGEPTRTHYEQSKSAINRRFCYNQKEYQLSDTLSFFVHRLTYNIRNGIIETQILCCIALSLTGSFVIKKARLEL